VLAEIFHDWITRIKLSLYLSYVYIQMYYFQDWFQVNVFVLSYDAKLAHMSHYINSIVGLL
jgi:hypothetical protein